MHSKSYSSSKVCNVKNVLIVSKVKVLNMQQDVFCYWPHSTLKLIFPLNFSTQVNVSDNVLISGV